MAEGESRENARLDAYAGGSMRKLSRRRKGVLQTHTQGWDSLNVAIRMPGAVAHGGWPTPGYDSPTRTSDAPMAGLDTLCVEDDHR
jgi:hypothetical protein